VWSMEYALVQIAMYQTLRRPAARRNQPGVLAQTVSPPVSMDMRARVAMFAAVDALGLSVTENIMGPDAVIVSLPAHFSTEAVALSGFDMSLSDDGVISLEIMLVPFETNASLAAIMSVVSRLSRMVKAQGGAPDAATALDLVVDVFRAS
jgi:hypothetical protein